jgi:integration host factor subunit beta
MNQLDLINKLKNSNYLSIPPETKVIDLFFGEMTGTLAMGDRVEIRGLCLFSVNECKGYTGRNPKSWKRSLRKQESCHFSRLGRICRGGWIDEDMILSRIMTIVLGYSKRI